MKTNYIAQGNQVVHVEGVVTTGIAQALDSEAAHFLATAANTFDPEAIDYMAECDKTCSTVFAPEQIEVADLRYILQGIVNLSNDLNVIKKLLFRGKSRVELGLNGFEGISLKEITDYGGFAAHDIDTLHGAIGVITEAGEIGELLLNFLNSNTFDRANVLEETGDVNWYVVRMLRGIGVTREQCDRANINKLRGRHGEAFDVFRDANRDLGHERAKLEDDLNAVAPAPLLDGVEVVKNPTGDKLDEVHAKGVAAVMEVSGERGDMADKIREINNADSVKPLGTVTHSVKTPIGDCEGMDC